MMYARVQLLLLAFLTFAISGCKKEKDERGPVIDVIVPGNAHVLNVPDTLTVLVNVHDEQTVTTVWISLADHDGVPIAPDIVVDVNAPSTTIEREIVVSSEHIISGNYSLSVRATDGTNTTSAFRSVNVVEAPLRLRALFVLPPSSGTITRIDSVGIVSSFATVQNVSGAAINSIGQHLYLAGDPFAPLNVMAASDQGTTWQLTNQNAQTGPYFTDLTTDPTDQRTYVSSNDGLIRAFRSSNVPLFNAQAFAGYRPYTNAVVGQRLISEQHAIGQEEKRLASYAYSSGALLETFLLDMDVIDIYQHSNEQALIFGIRDGDGVIQLRNVVQGGSFEMRVFQGESIIAVEKISSTTYVIVLPARVVRFAYTNNSVTDLFNTTVSDVAYDPANGALYLGSGQQVLVIDPNTGSVTNSFNVPTIVGKILPLFNR